MKDCTLELENEALISNLYHSIAQPLTALRGTLDLALRKPLDVKGYRKAILEAIDQHERLVKTVKEARQVADASAPRRVSNCDVTELVNEILDEFEPVAKQCHVSFDRHIEIGIRFSCDSLKLRQLLFLLVDNILNSCGRGELVIELTTKCAEEVQFVFSTAHATDAAPSSDPSQLLRWVLLKSLRANLVHEAITGHSCWVLSIPGMLGQIGSKL